MKKHYLVIASLLLILCSCNDQKVERNNQLDKNECCNSNSIKHTVLFNLKHEEGSVDEKQFLADGNRILSTIAGVHNFKVMRQISAKNKYRWFFYMEFENDEAYKYYNNCPEHVDFVENRWKTEVIDFMEIDLVNEVE